jgi:chromosome segregation ATPase
MADLNHSTKAELAQQIEDLKIQKQIQQANHEQLLKRAEDKIAAYEKQIGMLNNELNRLNVMIREAIGQRDQARQALVEGTLNSTKLVDLSQPRNMAAANPN